MKKPWMDWDLDERVDFLFTAMSAFLFLLTGWVLFREFTPEYKKFQDEAYLELAKHAEEEGDYDLADYWLKGAEKGIRQQFLVNDEVERCITCHVDDAGIEKWHLENVNGRFPTSFYGCTVCHGGEMLALTEHQAHHGLKATKEDMEKKIWSSSEDNAKPMIDFWERLQEISPPIDNPAIEAHPDYRDVNITGEQLQYMTSAFCLTCHAPESILEEMFEDDYQIVDSNKDNVDLLALYIAENDSEKIVNFISTNSVSKMDMQGAVGGIDQETIRLTLVDYEERGYIEDWAPLHAYSERSWWHINRWRNSKFKTFEVVKEQPDYINGDDAYQANCKSCHTTGYNKITNTYIEEGVTCEACHGPGQVFSALMTLEVVDVPGGTHSFQAYGASLAAISDARNNMCAACHSPNRHELRPNGVNGEPKRLNTRRYESMLHFEDQEAE